MSFGRDFSTRIDRPANSAPFSFSAARSHCSSVAMSTKANPLACPVSLYLGRLTKITSPYWENMSLTCLKLVADKTCRIHNNHVETNFETYRSSLGFFSYTTTSNSPRLTEREITNKEGMTFPHRFSSLLSFFGTCFDGGGWSFRGCNSRLWLVSFDRSFS